MRPTRAVKKMKTMDRILLILGLFFLAFVVAVLWIFAKTGLEPVVLVGAVAAAVIGEIIALLRIKIGKQCREGQNNDCEKILSD